MNDERHWWAPVVGAAVVLMLFGCLALVAAGGWTWFATFFEGKAADWAQAVFGALAILVAYQMGHDQMAESRVIERDKQLEEAVRRVEIIATLLADAQITFRTFGQQWERNPWPPYQSDHGEWLRVKESISGIDPFTCPSQKIVILLLQLPTRLSATIEARANLWRLYFGPEASPAVFKPAHEKLFDELEKTMGVLTLAIEACAATKRELVEKIPRQNGYDR